MLSPWSSPSFFTTPFFLSWASFHCRLTTCKSVMMRRWRMRTRRRWEDDEDEDDDDDDDDEEEEDLEDDDEEDGREEDGTVSYTHLTLPTICSV
eukprot:176234-Rhodomonas_salina.1